MWNLLKITEKITEKIERDLFMGLKQVGMKTIEKVFTNLFNGSDSKIDCRSEVQ
jgi:hypothetical protein